MTVAYPNLKGAATKNLVEKVDAGKYKADYINWSRTMQVLRDEAPGWLPELVPTAEGGYVHRGGVGGFLLIRFIHQDGTVTPGFPQAIMDNRNAAIPVDKITARDITDTHRRGLCMAAALAFGLAYELWAKMPLESGYQDSPSASATTSTPPTPGGSGQAPLVTEPAAGEIATAEQVEQFMGLVAKVAELDPKGKPADWWAEAASAKKYRKKVALLTADELAGLSVLFQEHYATLAGVAPVGAEPSPSAAPAPASTLSAGETASGDGPSEVEASEAPAEQSLFQAPTGPRGSKAAA